MNSSVDAAQGDITMAHANRARFPDEPKKHSAIPVVFADTGSEHPETYAYIERIITPFCRSHSFEFIQVCRKTSLHAYCRAKQMIPVVGQGWCREQYKIRPIRRWIRERFQRPYPPCMLGFSVDEAERACPFQAANGRPRTVFRYRFPLLEVGWSRDDCVHVIREAGLPVPPKSGCWCCPYTSGPGWVLLKERHPELFRQAASLERRSRMQTRKLHRNTPIVEVVQLWEPRVRAGLGRCGGGCDRSICGL